MTPTIFNNNILYQNYQISFLDSKLQEIRNSWRNHVSGGLIIWADIHFNLQNNPNVPLKLSDEVKWQIYFAAHAKKHPSGLIDLGSRNGGQFATDHLNANDLVVLYRILRSYHFSYERVMGGENIFLQHLEVIENRFRSSPQVKEAIIEALRVQSKEDPSLSDIIRRLNEQPNPNLIPIQAPVIPQPQPLHIPQFLPVELPAPIAHPQPEPAHIPQPLPVELPAPIAHPQPEPAHIPQLLPVELPAQAVHTPANLQPTLRALTIDEKLQAALENPRNYPSMGVILFSTPELPNEVKEKILLSAQTLKDQNGRLQNAFSIDDLNIDHLVKLYIVFFNYHEIELFEKENEAIFDKHLQAIEEKLKVRCGVNHMQGEAIVQKLRDQNERNLVPIIDRLEAHLTQLYRPVVLPPPITIPVDLNYQARPAQPLRAALLPPAPMQPLRNIPQPAPAIAIPLPRALPQVTDPTYCSARVGFPNPSGRNCGYNSLSVVYAHTRLADEALRKGFTDDHLNNDYDISMLNSKIAALPDGIDAILTRITELKQELEPINAEIKKLQDGQRIRETMQSGMTQSNGNYHRLSEASRKADALLQPLLDDKKRLDRELEREEPYLQENREELEDLPRKRDLRIRELKEENYANVQRSIQVLRILRGEQQGQLSERDAQILCETVGVLFGESGMSLQQEGPFKGLKPYNGPDALTRDLDLHQLKAAVNDPNWRVIRVGGHGHWWTYVRNPDNSIDEINDRTIKPKQYANLDTLLAAWSAPQTWKMAQMTFFGNNTKKG